ncbi:type VII secretion-associated serine protease mycosin [Streptomyces pactum]|uniref:Type VII secretion-associated serine protease mycosin n=1 Tax=Streptomyces pactum TaxID=68249 RepID=A0ABS0NKF0_9ACTN|nr:type VII secretion-associated serine protease mycosin [Streptomyces pactum]MBH5335597.1 type VII secretion-associated serine protease mycosin [Streptomyces pactum]
MSPDKFRTARLRGAATGVAALLLIGSAVTPAHAESIRSRQWYLDVMKAEQMWRTSTGKGVTVAVIDSGVNDRLADLRGQVLPGKDEAPESPGDEHTDPRGHGTSMALLIAGTGKANGGNGTLGLAPGAKILPIRLQDRGLDAFRYSEEFNDTLSKAIRYATDSGARVINISLAQIKGSEQLTSAVRYAVDNGALIFAGVGNDGNSRLMYPAATPGVVGVAAVGKDLHRTKESNWGPQVDLSAPGEEMIHTCSNGVDVCDTSGTSDATALASASAALIWAKHPEWTNNQVLRVMLNTIGGPTNGAKRTDAIGYGIVRPRIALKDPGDPGPADVYPLPDLKEAEAPSAKPSAEPSPSPSRSSAVGEAAPAPAGTASGDGDGGTGSGVWIAAGVGGALLAAAVPVGLAVRRRRAATASPVPGAAASPGPGTWPRDDGTAWRP